MIVLFTPSPQSIIKAFMASRVYKAKPIVADDKKQFYFDDTMSADSLDYDSLYSKYKEVFGGLDFLEDDRLSEILEDEIFWASRYNSPDRFQLIFTVLSQIESEGTKKYLAQESPEAKEMKDRIRRVTGEFRRAKAYMSFSQDPKHRIAIAKGSLEHNIVDLVLRHFAKRNPGYSIAIIDDDVVHILYNDEILIDSRKKFPEKFSRKDFGRYWLLFSDMKHLESRRDKTYSLTQPPRNYWKWISDGAQAFGTVPKVTLDDF